MAKQWTDPRVPTAQDCVLRELLDKHAAQRPDKVFARFADGTQWTYAQTLDTTRRTAAGLQALGVQQGDMVHVWLPNGPDVLRIWFAINYLGAVYVPINLAYRGGILAHAIRLSGARLIIAHAGLTDRLSDIDLGQLQQMVVLGHGDQGGGSAVPGLQTHDASTLLPTQWQLAPLARPIQPWDLQSIIYTSGTTGPSKGVMSSYLHAHATGQSWDFIGENDRQLVLLPLFHVGGTGAVFSMLLRGASIAVVEAFQTDAFWHVVTEHAVTFAILLGSMATLLVKQPPSAADRAHTLRTAMMIPLLEDAPAFHARFGVAVYTLFNMTEISCPIVSGMDPGPMGTCGQPRAGVQVRVVDNNDCEVEPGTVGELIVRCDQPWSMTTGYYGNAEATATSWRNGWFHTGDAFRTDDAGNYFFVDRMKDAIRRRGENISSFEVEVEVNSHPAVLESAAVAVPSEHGEDEVMVAVVLRAGAVLTPLALIEHLVPRMPHFMVPRYVRLVDALPRTPTQKVQKHLIRALGVDGATWDREQAGIVLRRQRL